MAKPAVKRAIPGPMSFRLACCLACSLIMAVGLGCSSSGDNRKPPPRDAGASFSVFFSTELRGTIEPCGCTSDPLGDLARTVALVEAQRGRGTPVLFVDGGSTLFSEPNIPKHLRPQELLKAKLIRDTLQNLGNVAIGLGPNDLAFGFRELAPPRHAANLSGPQKITHPPQVFVLAGIRVGVFGVVAPASVTSLGLSPTAPITAAKTAIAQLKAQGATHVIGIAHMVRAEAIALAKAAPGIDFLLIGQNAPEPSEVAPILSQVRNTWLLRPANRGQVITQVDLTVRGTGPIVDAIGEYQAQEQQQRIATQITDLESQLNQWRADPKGDPQFIKTKEKELTTLRAAKKDYQQNPLRIPTKGSWFIAKQVKIRKSLSCDPKVTAAKRAFDKAAGAANLAAAKHDKVPAPKSGDSGYAGLEECSYCHAKATKFWQTTKHAKAYSTLEALGKQYNYDCISCHVTGWQKPGGATLGQHDKLKSVQCEVCHGPGSQHVDAEGTETPKKVILSPAETVCIQCHNSEHSDTFDFKAYLRDITGPGHGEKFRKKLGSGPTGHQLRSRALEAAGKSIGKGCPK